MIEKVVLLFILFSDYLYANHILFAQEIIYLRVSVFFNLCLVHSYLPVACTNSVVTPLVINKHDDVSAISNYRPIALSTVILSILCRK